MLGICVRAGTAVRRLAARKGRSGRMEHHYTRGEVGCVVVALRRVGRFEVDVFGYFAP